MPPLTVNGMQSPNPILLAPSILAGDHGNLRASMDRIQNAGLSWAHMDIMDGHFVPNLTFGPGTVRALREHSRLFFDVHLMLDNPSEFVRPFAEAGADQISIHVEPDHDVDAILARIRELGCQRGLVLNPDTPAEEAEPFLDKCEIVLLMTVVPGFGGQKFREDVLPKMEYLANLRKERELSFRLEVDGGIDPETAPRCIGRGVDTLVAGTAFFRADAPRLFAEQTTGAGR